jgi:hypothetical protein
LTKKSSHRQLVKATLFSEMKDENEKSSNLSLYGMYKHGRSIVDRASGVFLCGSPCHVQEHEGPKLISISQKT